MAHLGHNAKDPDEPVAILWGDNYMNDTDTFLALLDAASEILQEGAAQIVFIGETPRFANENLGWIGLGDAVGQASGRTYYAFRTWNYRPPLPRAEEMYASGKYVWNTGYFVTTIGFVQSLYEQHQPEMWEKLDQIENAIGTNDYNTALHRLYPKMEVISFDDAILSYVAADQAVVLHGEMGWSDPGTLYALKEALAPDENENLEWGLVRSLDTRDSLLVNEEEGKLMAVIGLEGIIVVNTDDALLVVHKDDIADVKQFVNSLQETNLEKYT
jgi:mannose-1-phosphate guanylyltransferase